jgi:transposase
MPKLIKARDPQDVREERRIRRLARSRLGPRDCILRARMVALSWDGRRVPDIAAELGCHPKTVRARLARFDADGVDGLRDRPRAGRSRRLTEVERSRVLGLVALEPPGRLVRGGDGELAARDEHAAAHRTLDALAAAAQAGGIAVGRSQVRRIFRAERVRWRQPRSWADSGDPEFDPKGRRSSPATPAPRPGRRPSASTSSAP